METPMKKLIEDAIQSVNSVADVNTVIGEPVTLANGVTIVPFSKVSVGFATGGSDRAPKTTEQPLFAGGGGAGISVTPLGFLVVSAEGNVTLMDLKQPDTYAPKPNPVDRAIDGAQSLMDRAPGVIERIKDILSKKKEEKADGETTEEIPAEAEAEASDGAQETAD